MASLMAKNLSSVSSLFLSSRHHKLTILTPLLHFSTQIKQKDDMPFMANYLMSSFGFSEDRALRVASHGNLVAIKTPDRPESVIRFLKDTGLTNTQIKIAVSSVPQLLSKSVRKTLEPAANKLITSGFTKEALVQLIRSNPMNLTHTNLVPKLQFWRNFAASEENFLKLINKWMLINLDINKRVIPGISLLREHGLSDQQIVMIIVKTDSFFFQAPDSIKLIFERIEKLGFTRGSKMFLQGLVTVGSLKADTLDRKLSFIKTTYGWSNEDINLAIKKHPGVVNISQKKISSIMDFLISKVGLNSRNIALWPRILSCSLKKRLIPRHYVLSVLKLKSKRLKHKWNFWSLCIMSEKLFEEKFILPYEEIPDLGDAYVAACAGKMPLL